jgi:hypothetical protein
MQKNQRSFLLIVFLFSFSVLHAEWVNTGSSTPQKAEIQLISSDINTTVLNISVWGFDKRKVQTPKGEQYIIGGHNFTPMLEAGMPDLGKLATSVVIPDDAEMELSTDILSFVDIPAFSIAPSKGNLLRTINPADVPYHYGTIYNQNRFYPGKTASLRTPFIMRDLRGQTVVIYPFQYNPVTQTLRVYTQLTITITHNGQALKNANSFTRTKPFQQVDRDFSAIYASVFKNGQEAINYLPVNEDGEMLIISDNNFMQAMQPFIDWKIKKGIQVTMVDVATTGVTASQIKAYIQNFYASHNLKYVLMVGDVQQIPTMIASGGASDPSYGYLSGNDSYPEVFVGRFSAQSVADVVTQVQRSVQYELNPDPAGQWYGHGVCIGSDQGPGDDNEMDYEHERNIRTKELAFTYTAVSELYDGTQGGVDLPGNPNPSHLANELNNGASIVTYTGHGSSASLGTTGFSNTDVAALINTNKLPFIWSVACVNGEFNNGTCLAEAFLRASQNGQPTGAVATFMSSINQSWNPPMDAQDEMVDLLVGTNGSAIKRTFGGLSQNGCMHMNDQYGAAGDEMTNTWHCFGDPSLNVRTATPYPITAVYNPVINLGMNQLTVSSNTDSAFVCLSSNGQILATGLIINGMLTLTFNAVTSLDTIYVTITAFNGIPYTGTLLVVPSAGPFITNIANQINDLAGNSNQQADFGESIDVDVTLQNYGTSDAQQVSVTVSSVSPYISLTQNTFTAGNILVGASANVPSAFSYAVQSLIPDNEPVLFNLVITDSVGNSWTSAITHYLKAPVLALGNLIVSDPTGNNNGILEPGETADLIVNVLNNGHSNSPLSVSTLSTTSPYVTINTASYNTGTIAANGSNNAIFNVSLAPNTQLNTLLDFTVDVNGNPYTISKLFNVVAGEILENFETGDFTKFPWQQAGVQPWSVVNSGPYQGTYSARSGAIGDGDTSTLFIQANVLMDDSISFYTLISTEPGWDFLNFYIDGTLIDSYSGIQVWAYKSYPLTSGYHILTWSYIKDEICCTGGMDAVMLDNIKFPPAVLVTSINQSTAIVSDWSLYPNPGKNKLTISGLQNNVKTIIKVMDISGQVLMQQQLNKVTNTTLDVSRFAKGIYFVSITDGNQTGIKKWVKE